VGEISERLPTHSEKLFDTVLIDNIPGVRPVYEGNFQHSGSPRHLRAAHWQTAYYAGEGKRKQKLRC
jgi:hypothetical protein